MTNLPTAARQVSAASPSTSNTEWATRYAASAREIYQRVLCDLAHDHAGIVCVEADHGGFAAFAERFPSRYFDVGIAEASLMSVAAGLALAGATPFVNTMATFATTRACEQLKLDIAYPNAGVRIIATHGGLSAGHYGPSHHALEDIAITRSLPNMTVIVPVDAAQTELAVRATLEIDGPVYVRLGRAETPLLHSSPFSFEVGRAERFRTGSDVAIFACGPLAVVSAVEAAHALAALGVDADVWNVHTVKPLDGDSLIESATRCARVVTVETHSVIGGLGSAVAELLGECAPTPLRRIGVPDIFCELVGDERSLLDALGVCSETVVAAALGFR